jgi:hypothetical protein
VSPAGKRAPNPPWKGAYETDRAYRARVDRARERGQYTEPGTKPNAMDPAKVARKRKARLGAAETPK